MEELIVALITTIFSSIIAVCSSCYFINKNKKYELEKELDSILKIVCQYPYLESKKFTKTWKEHVNDDDECYLRYDIFCNLIWNYLERLSKFYKFDLDKIQNEFDMKSWARLHKDNFYYPTEDYENVDAYHKKFIALMDEITGGK